MRATFPAGTVSGSPKVRALQIINGCEKNKRGIDAGAVGYFGFDGNTDTCIVADSTPEGEYSETVNKAMGMLSAIERAKACVT
jgi:anthranilate synthase component 1